MITKEKLKELTLAYEPGLLRKLHLRDRYSENMDSLVRFVEKLPQGTLSSNNMVQLYLILDTQEKTTETKKVFDSIQTEIDKFSYLNRIWTSSKNMAGYLTQHVSEELFLSALLYETKLFENSYLLAGKSTHTICQLLAARYIENQNHLKITSQLLTLALQTGMDYATGSGGVLIVSYLAGSALESASGYLVDTIKESAWYKNNKKYPELLFNKGIWQGVGYALGAYAGKKIFNTLPTLFASPVKQNPTQQNNTDHTDKDNTRRSDTPEVCYVTELTEQEQKLLQNDKECTFRPTACQTAASKMLNLDPSIKHGKKAIKDAYFRLMKQWHPDKNKFCSPDILAAESSNISSAREILMKRK